MQATRIMHRVELAVDGHGIYHVGDYDSLDEAREAAQQAADEGEGGMSGPVFGPHTEGPSETVNPADESVTTRYAEVITIGD